MNFTSRDRRIDRAESATTAVAVVLSTGLYLRYRHPYLARGVLGDLVGLAVCSVPLAARSRRMRHEALVCLAGIGAVHAIRPRWPLRIAEIFWWSSVAVGLACYLTLRQTRPSLWSTDPPVAAHPGVAEQKPSRYMVICVNAQAVVDPTDAQVDQAVEMLSMVADPTRMRIMWTLLHGEHSVNELADHLGARPAAVSQHLAKLRLRRLVSTRREGTRIFYLADNDHVRRLVGEALFHADHVVQGLPAHHKQPTRRRVAKPGRTA